MNLRGSSWDSSGVEASVSVKPARYLHGVEWVGGARGVANAGSDQRHAA